MEMIDVGRREEDGYQWKIWNEWFWTIGCTTYFIAAFYLGPFGRASNILYFVFVLYITAPAPGTSCPTSTLWKD